MLLSAGRRSLLVSLGVLVAAACSPSAEESAPEGAAPVVVPDAVPPVVDEGFDGATTPACILAEGTSTLTGDIAEETGTASAVLAKGSACARELTVASTASRRDEQGPGSRTLVERAERPSLQSRNVMFDALYQLALAELDDASVSAIRDGSFRNGEPLECKEGCFETGKKWPYVWTRDTAYAAHLGLAWFDPTRARSSLELKTSTRRDGTDLQIVQDTGTGGSYPVSTDRVVWALGAREVLRQLEGAERAAFAERAFTAITNTLKHDRAVVFDAEDGLYRGEQSFLDWRSQSYPAWTVPDTVHIATSKSLSTNVAHLAAMDVAAELAEERGDGTSLAQLRADATALRERIRARFWLADEQQFSSLITTELDPAPTRRFDLLGTSLAILLGVATPEQASAAVAKYPVLRAGPPVLFPQQQDTAIYHNRAIWPFVTAYFASAGKKAGNGSVVAGSVASLMRGAALNLTNVENLELVTGKPWVDDGASSGPVVNSQRQLWSVAGYVHMVHGVIFGLAPARDGLDVTPFVPRAVRSDVFGAARSAVLNNVRVRGKQVSVVLRLPPLTARRDGAYAVGRVKLNGRVVQGRLREADLAVRNLVEVELLDEGAVDATNLIPSAADYRVIFGPRTPGVTSVTLEGAALAIAIDRGNESAQDLRLRVYRDGVLVANDLPGTTTRWVDAAAGGATADSHCYTVESRFVKGGNASQRAKPMCFWGADGVRVDTLDAAAFAAVGGTLASAGGRSYRADWGDPTHTLAATFVAKHSGRHLVQAIYANGAGPIDTGITCAVKRVEVREMPGNTLVSSGYAVMPQRGAWGDWADSSSVRATLVAGRTYRVVIAHDDRAVNMSAFEHFAHYTGGSGGEAGATYRVDISALKILAIAP